MLKGGRKGEAKAKATLFFTMRVERTFVCKNVVTKQKATPFS